MKYFSYFVAQINSVFMSITTTLFPKTDYHFFYSFLLVMSCKKNDDQFLEIEL